MLILQAFGVMIYVLAFGLDNAIIVAPLVRRLGGFQWIYVWVGPFVIVTLELLFPVSMVSVFGHGDFFAEALAIVRHPQAFAASLDGIKVYTGVFAASFLILSGAFGLTENASGRLRSAVRGSAVLALAAAAVAGGLEFGLGFAVMAMVGTGMWAAVGGLQNAVKRTVNGSVATVLLCVEVIEFAFSLDSLSGALTVTSNPLVLVGGLLMGAFVVRTLVRRAVKDGSRVLEIPGLEFGAYACIATLGAASLAGIWMSIPDLLIEIAGLAIIGTSAIVGKVRRS